MDEVIEQRSYQLEDELSLVQRAQKQDTAAFAKLYEVYFDKIYRYIALKIRNETEAEDMTQQVFMKALKSISSYKNQGVPFSSWLYRIAHNLTIDYFRKNRKATVPIDDLPLAAVGGDPQKMVEQKMDVEELAVAIKKLTPSQQEVLSLRFTGDLSINECAEIMGKSEGAIKALQHSAVIALRKVLVVGEV
jgi:RNA polymerase sigma-70 factor, ECF subfamily